jgi:ABC-2 type transport system ATP-binding protein
VTALDDLSLSVPDGALYALLGPNGSGKTTLLQILMGLRRARHGHVSVLGVDPSAFSQTDRASIGYIAEGQVLPKWMRLEQLERYLAPLYPTWDASLAQQLRERFGLDPARKVGTLSRGEQMKAALLCALAPRPRLLIMDEPFTGMDAAVKDDLVRGLLESAGTEGWTVLLSSHDLGELELLADWVGFLDRGRLRVSEPIDELHARFRQIEIVLPHPAPPVLDFGPGCLAVDHAGTRLSILIDARETDLERIISSRFPDAVRIEARAATLRELFVALARASLETRTEVAV